VRFGIFIGVSSLNSTNGGFSSPPMSVSNTQLIEWEALQEAANTQLIEWEALQEASNTQMIEWEALQEASNTKNISWEALQTVSNTKLIDLPTGGTVSTSLNIEWYLNSDPREYIGAGLHSYWSPIRSTIGYSSGVNVNSYEDLSGNGHTLTATANYPTYVSSDSNFNSKPIIDFSGTLQMLEKTSGVVDFQTQGHFVSVFAVHVDADDGTLGFYQLGTATINTGIEAYMTGTQTLAFSGKPSGTLVTRSNTSNSVPFLGILEHRWDKTDGKSLIYFNGAELLPASTTGSAANFGNSITNIILGGLQTSSYRLNGQLGPVAFLAGSTQSAIDFVKQRNIRHYINDQVNIYAYKHSWAFMGDSRTAEAQAVLDGQTSMPSLIGADLGLSTYEIHNDAIIGQTTTQNLDRVNKNYSANWISYHDKTSRLVIYSGTNDIVAAVSNATIFQNIQDMTTKALADGFDEVYVLTIPKFGAGSYDTATAALNTLITTWTPPSGAFIVDIAPDAAFSDTSDGTYYQADKTHPTTAANQIIATYIETAAGLP
jgi:lysophospholipase L1-like esterase